MNLREWINNTIDILVTEKGVPFTGDVSFGIYDWEWEVIFHKDYYSENGLITVKLPPMHQNDYVFSLETDNGYTDPKEVNVMKSLKWSDQKRKMKVDIDQERDTEISNTEELLNAFYVENGNRIKSLETSVVDVETRSNIMKKDILQKIKTVDDKVKKTDTKINTTEFNLSQRIGKEIEWVGEKIEQVVSDTNRWLNLLSEKIEEKSVENGLFISQKVKEIKKSIPKSKILQYEVDDTKTDDKTLWTSEKISKEVKQMKKKVKDVADYGGWGASYFNQLLDVPESYLWQAWKSVVVNATEDWLEFDVWWSWWQASIQFENEGSNLWTSWTVTEVDFTGAGVTASRVWDKVTVDIPWWGGASSLEVTQNAHWFIDLDWLYFDPVDDTYKKAQSNSENTLGMRHVVEVVDANTFKIAKDWVHEIANVLAIWEYVLSPDTAWWYTQTIPWDLGDFVLYGMEVLSATEVSFYTVPAIRVGTQLEGTGTTNELAYWVDADTVWALPVATYPSLTELSYVKGVTSAIQTQLNALVPYTWATADLNLWTYDILSDTRRAITSAGMLIESANGTDVWLLWAWNTANVTWYGSHNYDTATQDTIAIFTGAWKTLWSATTATYPSLTELSYGKGVTSAIQTQLDAKEVVANKSTDTSLGTSNTLYPTQNAVKTYVDAVAQWLNVKESVRLATTASLPTNTYNNGASWVGATLTGIATWVLTIDGSTVALNDRLLIKDEATPANNGIYYCSVAGAIGVAYVLTRSLNMDTSTEFSWAFTFVQEWTTNVDAWFVCTTNNPVTVGTTAINWTQFSWAGQITAGAGMTKTGNTLDVVGTTDRILVNADSVDISPNYVGQSSITTLGTITSGVWSGTAIANANLANGAVANLSGTNTGDQTTIVWITGTTAQFNTALTDWDFATLAWNETLANKTLTTPVLWTPTSWTLTNCTWLPIAWLVASTSTALWVWSLELWHATDTTLSRVSAWVIAVEGKTLVNLTDWWTFVADISVPAEVYGAWWNWSNEVPTKNDLYDKIETITWGSGLTQPQVMARTFWWC